MHKQSEILQWISTSLIFAPRGCYKWVNQKTLIYFVRGSIIVWLVSCLTGMDSAALFMFNQQQIYLFGQIQASQTGGQRYSNTFPYKVSECSLGKQTLIRLDCFLLPFYTHVFTNRLSNHALCSLSIEWRLNHFVLQNVNKTSRIEFVLQSAWLRCLRSELMS